MQVNSEANRINYANVKHHRELVREHIDPNLINKIEISQHPSQNYQNAFKSIYQDELERTVEEHKEKKKMQQSFLQMNSNPGNRASFHQDVTPQYSNSPNQSNSISRIRRPFHDFEDEKSQKYNKLIENHLHQGSIFFKEQDAYQQRKKLELQATNQMLQQQLNQKEMQKMMKNQEFQKEGYHIQENRRRQI